MQTDYYTDANLAVDLKVLEVDKERETDVAQIQYGDVAVQAMATIFKKIKFETHENIGSGPIHLPEQILHTTSAWISLKDEPNWHKDRLEQGLIGMAHLLKNMVPMYVMCDPSDVYVTPQLKSSHNEKPTIFLYDRYPGGVGLSDQIYDKITDILLEARKMIKNCPCENGCPSCIGTDGTSQNGKIDAITLLNAFLNGVLK